MKREVLLNGLTGLVGVSIVAAILLPALRVEHCGGTQVQHKCVGILNSMRAYQNEFASVPTGTHLQILSALLGDNSRKIPFLEINDASRSNLGEFVDPWDTPYLINTGTNITVRSAGPDRKFGTVDDIVAP